MRGIASRLGVSATALYQHFDSKSAILHALRMYGLQRLDDALVDADDIVDPLERLRVQARRYLDFARDNPWLYSILMQHDGMDWDRLTDEDLELAIAPQRRVTRACDDAARAGRLSPDLDGSTAAFVLWAALHGLASLLLSGRLSPRQAAWAIDDHTEFVERFVSVVMRTVALSC